jgi:hypothetical protein
MSKRQEKISKLDEQIAQLENQRKQEVQKKDEEKRVKNQRHCKRGSIMEKALPDLIILSDEQFDMFVKRALATTYTRNVLAELVAKNNTAPKAENAEPHKGKNQTQEQANSQTVSNSNRSEN